MNSFFNKIYRRIAPVKSIKPIDILGEHFTLGHRLALGRAFTTDNVYESFKQSMLILHNIEVKPRHIKKLTQYFKQIIEGLQKWNEIEKTIRYHPSREETNAGYNSIYEGLGEFPLVDSIALRLGISHDDALQLPYSTVFSMLKKDYLQSMYERRLQKEYERKRK